MTSDEIVSKEGHFYGPWRQSRNPGAGGTGSLHADTTAQQLGFRGGAVAGVTHFELFLPLIQKAWGQRWFERGTLSIDFHNPTVDREDVRAILGQPPAGEAASQVVAWIERPDGMMVGKGTASAGDCEETTTLSAKDIHKYDTGTYSILKNVQPGDVLPTVDVSVTLEQSRRRMETITEPLPWYVGESPWGGPIATPSMATSTMSQPWRPYIKERGMPAVVLWGAAELRLLNGPVKVDELYQAGGEIVARGQSPKTEYFWSETYLNDATGGRVAELRMQLRFLKDSGELVDPDWPRVRTARR